MVAPLIAAAGGAALRMGGTRLAAGAASQTGARAAAGKAAQFGGNALLQNAAARGAAHQGVQQGPPGPQQVLSSKGQALGAYGIAAVRSLSAPGLSEASAASYDGIISPLQFGR